MITRTVTYAIKVNIHPSDIVKIRRILKDDMPDGDWSSDEAVINAIAYDYLAGGSYSTYCTMGPTEIN